MHFAKEKDFLLKILLQLKNAFRPIFHNVPYTVPYTSPTRPLHVPYVPYKFPQRCANRPGNRVRAFPFLRHPGDIWVRATTPYGRPDAEASARRSPQRRP